MKMPCYSITEIFIETSFRLCSLRRKLEVYATNAELTLQFEVIWMKTQKYVYGQDEDMFRLATLRHTPIIGHKLKH